MVFGSARTMISACMPAWAELRKCQKLHCSLVSSGARAPQLTSTTRCAGSRAFCLSTPGISAAPTFDGPQFITIEMLSSTIFCNVISASAGWLLLS